MHRGEITKNAQEARPSRHREVIRHVCHGNRFGLFQRGVFAVPFGGRKFFTQISRILLRIRGPRAGNFVRLLIDEGSYSKLDKLDQFYYLCRLDSELNELLEKGFKIGNIDTINIITR
jgi:hypothetical protein